MARPVLPSTRAQQSARVPLHSGRSIQERIAQFVLPRHRRTVVSIASPLTLEAAAAGPPGGSRGSDPGCPSLTPCANAGFSRAGFCCEPGFSLFSGPRAEADGARPATARSWTHKHPAPALQVGARLRFPLTARRVRVAWGRRAGDSKLDSRNDRDLFFFFVFAHLQTGLE